MVKRRRSRASARVRVGRVSIYEHHGAWWVYYRDGKKMVRRRVGDTSAYAEQVAAELNAQLSSALPTMFSFTPISISQLRLDFLSHHEDLLRSSVHTISRYRTATQHLLNYATSCGPAMMAHEIPASGFAHYLRNLSVSPNGHANTAKRRLRDKGVQFVLEVARSLFAFAQRQRNMPPYAPNPFAALRLDRMRIDDAKPIFVFDAKTELEFLRAASSQDFPIHIFMAKTGMRPGEVCHLLLEDLDLDAGWDHVRNKSELGWWIKTGAERSVPLVPELVVMLRRLTAERESGPVFLRVQISTPITSRLAPMNRKQMAHVVRSRITQVTKIKGRELTRAMLRTGTEAIGQIGGDNVSATFGFAGGVHGYFASKANDVATGQRFGVSLSGSRGFVFVPLNAVPSDEPFHLDSSAWVPEKGEPWQRVPYSEGRPTDRHFANKAMALDLLEAIETGREPICNARDGRWTIEMVAGIYESQWSGARERFPLRARG